MTENASKEASEAKTLAWPTARTMRPVIRHPAIPPADIAVNMAPATQGWKPTAASLTGI